MLKIIRPSSLHRYLLAGNRVMAAFREDCIPCNVADGAKNMSIDIGGEYIYDP